MYERKKYEVNNVNKRIGNKKHTNSTYNQPLSRSNKCTGVRSELAKSGDKEKLKKTKGRKSFVEIAVEHNKYEEIGDCIKDFVRDNTFYSQKELKEYLIEQYPYIFGRSKTEFPQNFYKCIESDTYWSECLKVNQNESERAVLNNLDKRARRGLREEVDKDGKIYEVGMSDKAMMDYLKLLWQRENRLKEADEKDNDKKKQELELELLRNRNKLLEAQIAQINKDDSGSYMDSFTADLDQLGD